ncbi:chloride channel protein [Pseudomonadota bacterium]
MRQERTPLERRERMRMRFAMMDKLGPLAAISILVGLLAGSVIIAFRLLVEVFQVSFLADGNPENYEALAWYWRLLLPTFGGLLIGVLFHSVQKKYRAVGVVHTMERLAYHQANLPTGNAVMQFLGAAIAIIFGHSVGREGPAVHLGATSGSRIGQWLQLPNNSNRTLVACGVAAAIAASFNTPLAAVIFSMEVVLMEYAIAGFIPVILSAVTATALAQLVFGNEIAFSVPALQLGSLAEMPYVALTGLFIGCLAALFIHSLQFFSRRITDRPLWQRTTIAGIAVGVCAVAVPQVMSLGYDTVEAAMLGQMGIWLLLTIMAVKILATTIGLGLGIPGGLIGPTLVIGSTAGASIGLVAAAMTPDVVSNPALYAMIGMGAMMGATLQAPLAAMTALLELTANPNIILPGMLAIVAANLVSSQVFSKASVFIHLIRARGLDYHDSPVAQSLRRISIANAMDRHIVISPVLLRRDDANALLEDHPHWIVVSNDDSVNCILPAADLARQLGSRDYEEIDMLQMPGQRKAAVSIDLRATLQEGLEQLKQSQAEALFVVGAADSGEERVLGVVTREDIEEHYHYSKEAPQANQK